ncbi:hypothetical protein [Humibacter ginsenosidimutans]|nr:hypothetical protein [Humibacter ginsenosidimutans]
MEDRHPTYPARVGASGAVMWTAVVLAVAGVVGFVITVAVTGV